MPKNSLALLEQQLFNEKDGNKFSKLKDKLLKKHQDDDKNEVLRILMRYVEEGQLLHWRNFLLTDIVDKVDENEIQYVNFFEWAITHPKLAYWSIDGLLKTAGGASFPSIISLIKNDLFPLEVRAKGIKSIAEFSRQHFDRALPSDPGYWKESDLRIAEVIAWAADGYKEGVGYDKPIVHESLANPKTALEKVANSLEKKLAKSRQSSQDLSNPSNWLLIADDEDIAAIKSKWTLPENYLLFLQNYSPLRVSIDGRKFVEGLSLYGAHELIKIQQGYAYNAVTNEEIVDWPNNLVVIADDGADPFCLDIAAIAEGDAPVLKSHHGAGKWVFEKYSDSFVEFLKTISR